MKKSKRVVLGQGYAFNKSEEGSTEKIRLYAYPEPDNCEKVVLEFPKYFEDKRVRLIAEVLDEE